MENKETVITNTVPEEQNCISRIKAKWSQRSRAFKIYYICLWIVSLICLGICIWCLTFVDWTRQDIISVVTPEYKKWLANNPNITQTVLDQMLNGDNGLPDKVMALIHTKYYGDVDKFAWNWASRPDVWQISDTYYSRLSYVCYPCFIIFAFIWAPIFIYCMSSFLNTAFPHISKKEKKAIKEAQKAQAENEPKQTKTKSAPAKKAAKAKPAKQDQIVSTKAVTGIGYLNKKIEDTAPKKKLKGDWLYYHERQKQKSPHNKGGSK